MGDALLVPMNAGAQSEKTTSKNHYPALVRETAEAPQTKSALHAKETTSGVTFEAGKTGE